MNNTPGQHPHATSSQARELQRAQPPSRSIKFGLQRGSLPGGAPGRGRVPRVGGVVGRPVARLQAPRYACPVLAVGNGAEFEEVMLHRAASGSVFTRVGFSASAKWTGLPKLVRHGQRAQYRARLVRVRRAPRLLAHALARIWPQEARDVAWPQQAFAKGDLDVLVSRGGALRHGHETG